METQLRKLRLLSRIFDLNKFYVIELTASDIRLQGHFNNTISKSLNQFKFEIIVDKNGYLNGYRNNINIVLT